MSSDVPGQPHDVLGAGAAFGQHGADVEQREPHLRDEALDDVSMMSQPIMPPVTMTRPLALMPLA